MIIYEIVNLINQKRYIGQTIQKPSYRWSTHKRQLNDGTHYNIHLQRAWNKYGIGSFEFNVIQKCDDVDALDITEQQIIDSFRDQCYNVAVGGQLNRGATYCKSWSGLVSPDGIVHNNILNLAKFARTHNLNERCFRRVAIGDKFSYKGWTLKGRLKKIGYTHPKGKKLSIATRNKMSRTRRKNNIGE